MRSTETSRIAQPADEVTLATSVSTAVMVPVDLAAVCSNDSNTGSGEGGTAGSTKAGSGALSGHLVLMSVRRGCGARRSSHEHGSKNSSLFHSMLRVDALCNHAPGKRICHDRCARTRGGHLGCSSCTVAHDVVNLSAISAQSSPRRPSADLQRSLDAWQHKRGDCGGIFLGSYMRKSSGSYQPKKAHLVWNCLHRKLSIPYYCGRRPDHDDMFFFLWRHRDHDELARTSTPPHPRARFPLGCCGLAETDSAMDAPPR